MDRGRGESSQRLIPTEGFAARDPNKLLTLAARIRENARHLGLCYGKRRLYKISPPACEFTRH
jgi:hypothetical protein